MKSIGIAILTGMLTLGSGAQAAETQSYFFDGKMLAHPVIYGAREGTAVIAFIKEANGVNGYYCLCEDEANPDPTQRTLDRFGHASIESVFFFDMDNAGPLTLVLSKTGKAYQLRAYRYWENGRGFVKVDKLQSALDKIISNQKAPTAVMIKTALAKLTPFDLAITYQPTGIAEFDAIDHLQGKLVSYFNEDEQPIPEPKDLFSTDAVFYKKTYQQKEGLFLTVTYIRWVFSEEDARPSYHIARMSWEADPKQYRGTEDGPYIVYQMGEIMTRGQYKQGKETGEWSINNGEQEQLFGTYVYGKRHGKWKIIGREASRTGMMVNDKREGRWEISDGEASEDYGLTGFDTFVNDRRNGPSERQFKGKITEQGNYVNGEKEGHWRMPGAVGSYLHDLRTGDWLILTEDGGREELVLSKGQRDGAYRKFDAKGQLREYSNYKSGELSGDKEVYSEQGKLLSRGTYAHGQLNGREIVYYEDGVTLRADRGFLNGELHGSFRYNFPNGKPQEIADYIRGRNTGIRQVFNEKGVLLIEANICQFSNGFEQSGYCGHQREFNPDGSPVSDKDYLWGRQQTNNSWYPNGQKKDETLLGKNDSRIQTSYYPNGQIECRVHLQGFEAFVLEGKEYKDNQGAHREGENICYYPNGQVKSRGIYKQGVVVGGCETKFDESGKQISPGPQGCPKHTWVYES
ncbi:MULTISPECIES: toxin-antitoxin system YwqK family antitoxin [Yersinia]|nr:MULTISPECIES: hypothetical protein [Yersinia]